MSYINYQRRPYPFVIRYISDLIRYRHLAFDLASSDLRARFRRSRLGILWAVIQPLGYSIIIAWAWGALFDYPNYWAFAMYVFSGWVVWDYFTTVANTSLSALSRASGYLKQSRIPLVVFQLRMPLTAMVIAFFATCGLAIMLLILNQLPPPGMHLLLLPAFFAIVLAFMIPIAIIFSLMGARFHDLQYIVGLGINALFFLSPIMLSRDIIGRLPYISYINPLVPLMNMFRDIMLDGEMWKAQELITIGLWTAGLWVAAIMMSIVVGRKVVFAI